MKQARAHLFAHSKIVSSIAHSNILFAQLNGSNYCYPILIIRFNSYLFAHC